MVKIPTLFILPSEQLSSADYKKLTTLAKKQNQSLD